MTPQPRHHLDSLSRVIWLTSTNRSDRPMNKISKIALISVGGFLGLTIIAGVAGSSKPAAAPQAKVEVRTNTVTVTSTPDPPRDPPPRAHLGAPLGTDRRSNCDPDAKTHPDPARCRLPVGLPQRQG